MAGNLMSGVEPRRNTGIRRVVLVTMVLVATIMVPFDPDHMLRETGALMVKIAAAEEIGKAARDTTTPPARDPEVAVQEEYHAARRHGTAQALELFIARHPDSALAEKARADLRQLLR
jgi:hypothetical protein